MIAQTKPESPSNPVPPEKNGVLVGLESAGTDAKIAPPFQRPSLFDPDLLVPELGSDSKIGAIKELVDRLHAKGIVQDSLRFLQSVLERENLQSTILDEGIALPHARSRAVSELGMALGIARKPIDFPSGDDRRPVHLICLIAVPVHAPDRYLALLGAMAHTLEDAEFKKALLDAGSAQGLYNLLVSRRIC